MSDTACVNTWRVCEYLLGGKDNFAAYRAVAEQVAAVYPDIRLAVRAQRAFLARAVEFLVTQAGIRQFLDIGTGLPSANNTHQVAQGILQGIPDQDEPGAIIARLMDTVTPGSYLAISQIASDVAASEVEQGVQRYNERAAVPVAARTHAEVCRFFTGLELVEPGVVQVHRWRAGTGGVGNHRDLAIYAGVARKP